MCGSFSWFQLLVKALTFARGIVDFTNKFVFHSILNVGQEKHPSLLQDAANATLRSETLRETVCDAIIANGAV